MEQKRPTLFRNVVATLLVVYGVIKWLIPFASQKITGMPFPLPVPGTLLLFYMTLTVAALFLYVTHSDETLDEFLLPLKKLLMGEYGTFSKNAVLLALPLVVGWQLFCFAGPEVSAPPTLRMQHPSSNFPKEFEAMKNPFENPTDAEIDAFIDQAKAGRLEFIPVVQSDIDVWGKFRADPNSHSLYFIPTKPWKRFLAELESGSVSRETARAALREKHLYEGRALYAINCRPCHGSSVAGDGPMAGAFSLRPTDFSGSGTIETIVEGYAFWRVASGGPGLPKEATPWDSAMPEWKLSLTDAERWKIIMAEYDLAGKTPRRPEAND